jgi:NAD(P)H dehydrogenase (quinone)
MFAITGITGKVGSATARALLDAGHQVRAIVRDQARGASWRSRGCEVAVADISDAPVLAEALAGAEGAFVLLPPVFDPAPGFADVKATIASIREALLRSAVPKAVVLSTIGADVHRPNLLNGLRFLEEALADLDMPIAFLRAAWFMENALWDLPSARDQGVIRSYLQPLDRPVPMVCHQGSPFKTGKRPLTPVMPGSLILAGRPVRHRAMRQRDHSGRAGRRRFRPELLLSGLTVFSPSRR